MTPDIMAALENGGRVIVRKRSLRRGMQLDTELSSRYVGLMAIAKAEAAGEIRVKRRAPIPKGILIEYELVTRRDKEPR